MINLGNIIGLLLLILSAGLGVEALRTIETEVGEAAVDAHKSGYISIQDFHQRLVDGR